METQTVPIFFSSNDDRFLPYLDVSILSLVEHTTQNFNYEIWILNTHFSEENKQKLRKHERENVKINFFDVTEIFESVKHLLPETQFSYFSYFRLFIEKAFPQYDKAIYLDCDIVVLADIAELFCTDIKDNLVGAAYEQNTGRSPVFTNYVEEYIGIPYHTYFNSGVMIMNLKEIRKLGLLNKFLSMLRDYHFDCIAIDQEYLNVICHGRVFRLPTGWNKHSFPEEPEGELKLCHYALAQKPWHYKNTINGEYFWEYAKKSQFYEQILEEFENFGEEGKKRDAEGFGQLLQMIDKMKTSERTFKKLWFDQGKDKE